MEMIGVQDDDVQQTEEFYYYTNETVYLHSGLPRSQPYDIILPRHLIPRAESPDSGFYVGTFRDPRSLWDMGSYVEESRRAEAEEQRKLEAERQERATRGDDMDEDEGNGGSDQEDMNLEDRQHPPVDPMLNDAASDDSGCIFLLDEEFRILSGKDICDMYPTDLNKLHIPVVMDRLVAPSEYESLIPSGRRARRSGNMNVHPRELYSAQQRANFYYPPSQAVIEEEGSLSRGELPPEIMVVPLESSTPSSPSPVPRSSPPSPPPSALSATIVTNPMKLRHVQLDLRGAVLNNRYRHYSESDTKFMAKYAKVGLPAREDLPRPMPCKDLCAIIHGFMIDMWARSGTWGTVIRGEHKIREYNYYGSDDDEEYYDDDEEEEEEEEFSPDESEPVDSEYP